MLDGLGRLAEASVSILIAPLGIMAAVLLPRAFRPITVPDPERASGLALLRRLVLFCLGLMLVYVAAGASYVKPHHLFFLAFAPLWLIARLDAATLAPWRSRGFAIGLAACAAFAAVAYPFDNLADARSCDACEEFQPIDDYAAAISAAGFERGTILALSRRQDFPTAALRAFFPEARVVASDYPVYAPPPLALPGDCLLVWSGARGMAAASGTAPPARPSRASGCPSPPMRCSATRRARSTSPAATPTASASRWSRAGSATAAEHRRGHPRPSRSPRPLLPRWVHPR